MDVLRQGKTVVELVVYEDIIGKPALKQRETVYENNLYVCLLNLSRVLDSFMFDFRLFKVFLPYPLLHPKFGVW
jgi:hypothetical protein